MKLATPFVLGLAAAALGLTGCTASPSQQRPHASAQPVASSQPVRITTLAASDSLGGLVFSSDVALGPTIEGTRPIYAEVPTR